jgi:hypothetical protein
MSIEILFPLDQNDANFSLKDTYPRENQSAIKNPLGQANSGSILCLVKVTDLYFMAENVLIKSPGSLCCPKSNFSLSQ